MWWSSEAGLGPSRLARAVLVAGAALVAAFAVVVLVDPLPFCYSDGDTATWAMLVRRGVWLWRPLAGLPLDQSNYPPAYVALVAALSPSEAAIPRTGELVSAAAYGATALMVASVVRRAGRPEGARWAGLLVVGSGVAASYGAACLPDALGLALVTGGAVVAARRARGWPLGAGLLFAAGILVKHSLIAIPAGTIGWAVLGRGRTRGERAAGAAMGATAALVVVAVVTALGLWRPLVMWSMGRWELGNLVEKLAGWVGPLGAGIALALRGMARGGPASPEGDGAALTLGPFRGALVAALGWSLALGRIGSGSNYLLELVVVTSVLATATAPAARLFTLHALASVAQGAIWIGFLLASGLPSLRAERAAVAAVLAEDPRPALVEQSWFASRLGRAPVVIPFLAAQLHVAGLWDEAPFVELIARGELGRVILSFDLDAPPAGGHADRFSPAVLSALRGRYALRARRDGLYVYAPR
jgi:hypothetical protein